MCSPQDKEINHRTGWRIVSSAKTLEEFREMVLEYWNRSFEPWVKVDVYDVFKKNKKWADKLLEALMWHHNQGNIYMDWNGKSKFFKHG